MKCFFLQIDKNQDGFLSYDEFLGSTAEKEYEQPDQGWEGIDDDDEFTDDEFDEYEKQFENGDFNDENEVSMVQV